MQTKLETTGPDLYASIGELIIRYRQRNGNGAIPVWAVLDETLANGAIERQAYGGRNIVLSPTTLAAIEADVLAQLADVPQEITASREAKLAPPTVKPIEPVEQETKK
jgi:hypothetical protein